MKKLFFDMDGVLAEYRRDCTEEDMKKRGYFSSLNPERNMIIALDKLLKNSDKLGVKVYVLTKVYPSDFSYSVKEKIEWKDEFLPLLFDSEFIMINGEKEEKSEAIKARLNVDLNDECFLIDDYNYNLNEWAQNGGRTIKYVNKINDKRRSFIGDRLFYTMSANEIYNSILEIINGHDNTTKAAA